MYKLMNMSNYTGDLKKFNNDHDEMRAFLDKNGFHGMELIQFSQWNDDQVPKELIKGLHLRFYPVWIDFWRGDQERLMEKVQKKENIKKLYGGYNRDSIIDYYKKELEIAEKAGVEYVVMHVCHIDLHESYSYDFSYSDEEVIEAAIEMINEMFKGEEYSFKLLLENLWWPGLKLLNKDIMKRLLEGINHPHVGFMLDTGHMINTNLELKNSDEAADYILNNLKELDDYKRFIKGIHLNYSLSGEYVKRTIQQERENKKEYDFDSLFMNVYDHISSIDYHEPFENEKVIEIINTLPVEYLVYELLSPTLEGLQEKIDRQDRIF